MVTKSLSNNVTMFLATGEGAGWLGGGVLIESHGRSGSLGEGIDRIVTENRAG